MQINRLFEIIYILLDKDRVSASELAERFEVSTRTIYRDIETLSSSGIPVYASKGKGGGISLLPNFVLNKTYLTEQEKAEILSSLSAINAVDVNDSTTAINKLSSLFGKQDADWLEVDFSLWYNKDKESVLFNALKTAILSKNSVEFEYANTKGESVQRKVEPLRLCFKGMSRYLYAYCTLRNDFRFFKLSRIKKLHTLSEKYTRVLSGAIFADNEYYDDEFVRLKLKISPKASFRVYDEFETYEQLADGSFIAEIDYPKENIWLFPYITSFGAECEVLEPKEIREQLAQELQKILNKYL